MKIQTAHTFTAQGLEVTPTFKIPQAVLDNDLHIAIASANGWSAEPSIIDGVEVPVAFPDPIDYIVEMLRSFLKQKLTEVMIPIAESQARVAVAKQINNILGE